jgi:uncharacterized protein (DUF1778 family)
MDNTLTTRIEARVTPETKALIQQAADIESSTLADFLSKSAQTVAQMVISKHNVLKLNAEDSKAFAEAILNPSEPTEALKKAMRQHKKEFGDVP